MTCCIKLLGTFNLLLGLVSLIIQIIALITNGNLNIDGTVIPLPQPTDNYGAGIWCGVVFLLVGIAAFKHAYTKNSGDSTWKIVMLVMAVLGVACGVVQVIIAGVTLDNVKGLGDLGSDCIQTQQSCFPSGGESLLCGNPIAGNFCNANTAYQATLIASGVVAVISDVLLILAAICSCC